MFKFQAPGRSRAFRPACSRESQDKPPASDLQAMSMGASLSIIPLLFLYFRPSPMAFSAVPLSASVMWTFPVGPLFKQNRIGMEFVDGPDKKREAARDALAQRYY
jgi:hypothetical protein